MKLVFLSFLHAVLLFASLAALAFRWEPKFGKITYAYLGYNFIISYFGNILDLPEWFSKPAILNWLQQMPKDSFDVITFITLTIMSILFIVLGYVGYRKRDLIG
ncbi:hypothetical protein MUA48_04850 [Staphylococcus sp. IVB6238]|uniref:hypothetical protein n=1 Tax=Staphylococcus sp. IVB6238 TaxID=2989770 RepID=UPI0021D30C26|nr:hypothetical protein [Staphylococcus sp. IVB6238]UXR74779.1 hypothetical protein MUA48_04850 [Staphylococcus sp. IVB6238]